MLACMLVAINVPAVLTAVARIRTEAGALPVTTDKLEINPGNVANAPVAIVAD